MCYVSYKREIFLLQRMKPKVKQKQNKNKKAHNWGEK